MDDTKLPLTDHLAELRSRILKALAAWVLGTLLAWSFSEPIFGWLIRPAITALGGSTPHPLQALAPTEIFFTYLKCALLSGLVLALPVIFWQAWAFVAPGLYPGERNTILPFVVVSTLLFVAGAVFGHSMVFPLMFRFLASFDSEYVQSAWSMREVFGVTTQLFVAFGAAFELPVVVFFLSSAGILEPRTLLRSTPYAILAIFIVAAILTPPDWVSQVLLAVPMVALYLLGVGVAFAFGGARRQRSEVAKT
jgi:sec-independent protein translocase protein TatC